MIRNAAMLKAVQYNRVMVFGTESYFFILSYTFWGLSTYDDLCRCIPGLGFLGAEVVPIALECWRGFDNQACRNSGVYVME